MIVQMPVSSSMLFWTLVQGLITIHFIASTAPLIRPFHPPILHAFRPHFPPFFSVDILSMLMTDAEYSISHGQEGFVHLFPPLSRSHTYFSPCLQQSAGRGGIVNICHDSGSSDRPASGMRPDDSSPTCGRESIANPDQVRPR